MKFTCAPTENMEPLLDLWQEAFGESKEEALPFFQEIFPLCRPFRALEGDSLCAMAYALPQTLDWEGNSLPVAYIYAVATKKERRGQGLARRLLDFLGETLKAEGCKGLLLVPAGEDLFQFYEKLGFSVFCHRKPEKLHAASGELAPCGEKEYLLKRAALLGEIPHNTPPLQVLKHLECYLWDGGCAAGEMTPEGFVFREVLGDTAPAGVIVKAADQGHAHALLFGEKGDTPYAVAKALWEDFPETGYFSFAME